MAADEARWGEAVEPRVLIRDIGESVTIVRFESFAVLNLCDLRLEVIGGDVGSRS